MAMLYYYGNVPVEKEEAQEKFALGDFNSINLPNNSDSSNNLRFREGTVNENDLLDNRSLNLPNFTPIGINKPLNIEILCTYVGNAPKRFLGRNSDIMTVSGIKAYNTYGAAPKAINHIKSRVEDNEFLRIGAFDEGSPIVYYCPAVDSSTLSCSFNLVADTFNEKTFQTISKLFASASGIPIFASASPFLIAGSVITGIIGKLGKTIFESKPFMTEDEIFRFDTSNQPISIAKQMLVCNEGDIMELRGFKPGLMNDGGGSKKPAMVHRQNGQPYTGDAPYMLVNIDGKEKPELENFAPKIATAAILEKYYGAIDNVDQTIDVMQTAMELYNDFHFFKKAKALSEKIESMQEGGENHNKALELLSAYKKNIKTDQFKIL